MPARPFLTVPVRLILGLALALPAVTGAKPLTPAGPIGFDPTRSPAASPAIAPDPGEEAPLHLAQFESVPVPLPANLASINFEETATAEYGDLVRLQGAAHFLGEVAVTFSTAALRTDFPGSSPLGYSHPITLSLYAVDRSHGDPRPGPVLARMTESFVIPWRPAADPAAALPGRAWKTPDGSYASGRAFTVTFQAGALGLSLPDEIIFGVSFPTQHQGAAPLAVPGPYDLLGLALTDRPATIGQDVEPDAVFWQTSRTADYADGGAGGGNAFRRDPGWRPFKPAVRFTSSAYGELAELAARLSALQPTESDADSPLRSAATIVGLCLDRTLWEGNDQLQPDLGAYVFTFLGEAADELAGLSRGTGPLARDAQEGIHTVLNAAESLATASIAEAIIDGGSFRRLMRAQAAFDAAGAAEGDRHYAATILHYGAAWQEAQRAFP